MKVKNTIKKVGAVAGSALMVGMTMGAAQSLSDFPQPFVAEDGAVQSQIVVGSQGKQADVVGAINVASALGQSAVQTETQSVSASGSFGWSASDGATLDTRNDRLFYGQGIDTVRETLTSQHLSALSDASFTDDDGDSYDVEYYLYPGDQSVTFGNGAEGLDNEDPVLHVTNPSDVSATSTDHLFQLQANFQDTVNFTDTAVQEGDDIELFGTEYSVSEDTTASELVMFGSTQSLSLSTSGQTSGTVTIDGSDHTIEIDGVNDGGVIYRVDGGTWQQDDATGQFTIDGETVRIDDIINRVDDAGSATFEVGSEELHFVNGDPVEDGDGDDIDGTHVEFNGGSTSAVDEVSTIDLYLGSDNDDMEYVGADESYSHDLFGNVEFHFGGLNPDASEGAGDNVGEVRFRTSGDSTATVGFTDSSGDEASPGFAHTPDDSNLVLADEDNDLIRVVEGANLTTNDYFTADAGDFAHLWEVTDIDPESDTGNVNAGDEADVTIQDAFSGTSVDITVDADGGNNIYNGTEVIDGQTYHVEVDVSGSDDVTRFYWGDGTSGFTTGGATTLFAPLDTESGASVGFVNGTHTVSHTAETEQQYVLPSTESSSEQTVTVNVSSSSPDSIDAGSSNGVDTTTTGSGGSEVLNATVQNGLTYEFTENPTAGEVDVQLYNADGAPVADPSAFVIEPEDDSSDEHAYVQEPSIDSDDNVNVNDVTFTGTWNQVQLESDSDVYESYDQFGTHTVYDSDNEGQFTLHIPDGQSAAGAAFTSPGGDLSAGGGGGSATYEAITGQGNLPNMARLDTEVTSSVRSQNHLILVGGPAVNQLVADLASDDKTWTQQEWLNNHEDEALVQVVEDAFTDGQHAMVVAGFGADDTRAAARYISNYADHEQALADAGNQLTLTEADYPAER